MHGLSRTCQPNASSYNAGSHTTGFYKPGFDNSCFYNFVVTCSTCCSNFGNYST